MVLKPKQLSFYLKRTEVILKWTDHCQFPILKKFKKHAKLHVAVNMIIWEDHSDNIVKNLKEINRAINYLPL